MGVLPSVRCPISTVRLSEKDKSLKSRWEESDELTKARLLSVVIVLAPGLLLKSLVIGQYGVALAVTVIMTIFLVNGKTILARLIKVKSHILVFLGMASFVTPIALLLFKSVNVWLFVAFLISLRFGKKICNQLEGKEI